MTKPCRPVRAVAQTTHQIGGAPIRETFAVCALKQSAPELRARICDTLSKKWIGGAVRAIASNHVLIPNS